MGSDSGFIGLIDLIKMKVKIMESGIMVFMREIFIMF
jgi:hypothetical protein